MGTFPCREWSDPEPGEGKVFLSVFPRSTRFISSPRTRDMFHKPLFKLFSLPGVPFPPLYETPSILNELLQISLHTLSLSWFYQVVFPSSECPVRGLIYGTNCTVANTILTHFYPPILLTVSSLRIGIMHSMIFFFPGDGEFYFVLPG